MFLLAHVPCSMIHEYDMYGTHFLYDWSHASAGI